MELIYGKAVANYITERVKDEVAHLLKKGERPPKLAIIRVGEKNSDVTYEKSAVKRMEMVGISHEEHLFAESVSMDEFCRKIEEMNEDEEIDAILLLRPLPKHFSEEKVISLISPEKDIDAISPLSLGKLMIGEKEGFAPCTALAVIEILKYAGVELKGKKVTIVGRSNVVGRPLALLFISEDATVTICHRETEDLKEATEGADILIAACGSPKLIKKAYVGKGAILVDVGINLDEEGRLCGDVDLEDVKDKVSLCTPVPGGVGAVTTSILAKQVLFARKKRMMRK